MCTRRVPCHASRPLNIQQYVSQQLETNPCWPQSADHGLGVTTIYQNDFCSLKGHQEIHAAYTRWRTRALRDLPDVQWTATAAAPCLNDGKSVHFTRTIRWVPQSIQWLVRCCNTS